MILKFFHDSRLTWKIIINNTINKFFLASDEFMPKMDLKQLWFVNSAYGSFIKNKKQIQKFKETGDLRFIYQNEVNKQCFQNEMPYGNFQDLAKKQLQMKYYVVKHFELLVIQIVKNIKKSFQQWFTNILQRTRKKIE